MADPKASKVLVVGMGASAFGRERRAVQALGNMRGVDPFFLISKWEDGSVSRLLRDHGLSYGYAPWGYLGRAKPQWTLVTLVHLPLLLSQVLRRCWGRSCRSMLLLSITPFVNALPGVLVLRFFRGVKLVYYLGDVPPHSLFHRLLGRLMHACSRHFLVNSEAVRAGLIGLGIPNRSIRTVYNGVAIERFERASARDFRLEFGWPEDALIIAYAGQLIPAKGVEDLLEAAALMQASHPEYRFLVMGRLDEADPYQRKLTRRVASAGLTDRIVFTGWIQRMEDALTSIDVLVVPSRHEDAAPNVILEAMACGKPVIGTRAGGIPELVRHGETGILIERNSPHQIASGVIQLGADESLRRRLGLAAAEACRERFDLVRNARVVEEALRDA